jgi:hypothetical protein
MDYLDKLIPFVILGAVGGLVFFLLRRAAREKDPPPTRTEMPIMKAEPVVPVKNEIPAPVPTKVDEEIKTAVIPATPPTTPPQPKAAGAQPSVAVTKKKRKRILMPVSATPKGKTPIVTVIGLLKEKESLAAAFLLREILAPPVSKR